MKYVLNKPSSEIIEPEAIPQDWYLCKLVKEPVQMKNKKLQDGGVNADGAGFNLIFNLRVEDEDPEINGRGFRFIASLPNKSDEGKTTNNGMSMIDFKEKSLVKIYAAFIGEEDSDKVDVESVEFTPGMKAYFFVERAPSQDGTRYVNFTSLNAGARAKPPEKVEGIAIDESALADMFPMSSEPEQPAEGESKGKSKGKK
uniref:Uncharacterized protein n=1 Tax=viral metagenome TaxID=1070528 RepID=A0A6H2A0D7_9ZZZZ